jgi:hypothetical protein
MRAARPLCREFGGLLALILLHPACRAFLGFFYFALAAALGSHATLDVPSDQEVGVTVAVLRAPVLELLKWVGVPVMATDTGLRLGSYDPQTGQSLAGYLFMSWEGWCICAIILLGGYVFLVLAAFFLNPVLESLRIRAEKRLERAAMETLERFGRALAGQELIHTSYFDHPPVLDLLALHVAWSRREAAAIREAARIDESLWNWFCRFKHGVHEITELEPSPHPPSPRLLLRPRRRLRPQKETGVASG